MNTQLDIHKFLTKLFEIIGNKENKNIEYEIKGGRNEFIQRYTVDKR